MNPTPQQLQLFDLCFLKMERIENVVVCTVKTYPDSRASVDFRGETVFNAMQNAMNWLSQYVRFK